MQQLNNLWSSMDTQRRIMAIGGVLIMLWAVVGLGKMASAPSMSLLYAGLEDGSAGSVVTALEQQGAAYEIRGESIYVEATRRDELRMILAGEGLPANSGKGYELLDSLSGFGTTSQMFDAAYWRAKEGELARTIVSHPSITNARVHIASTGSNPFRQDVQPSASVSISASSGSISGSHARALRFLVASAVPGLTNESVTIIDSNGELIGQADGPSPNLAQDQAEQMRGRVRRMLEAHVGGGNVVVEVSIDTVKSTERIREKLIDPESRVAISTDTEERTDSATDQGGNGVTVASNLPDGAGAAGETSTSQGTETRERINYEVSETEREISHLPGAIKRLTVAVLVNGITTTNSAGAEVYEPRTQEELIALQDLVSAAVGFDEARGDVITIKTLQFQPIEMAGSDAEPSLFDRLAIDTMSVIQAAILGIVALVMGLFVVRPLLMRPPSSGALAQLPSPGGSTQEQANPTSTQALSGEIQDGPSNGQMTLVSADTGSDTAAHPSSENQRELQVQRLRELIGERQEETVEILRSWLEEEGEKA